MSHPKIGVFQDPWLIIRFPINMTMLRQTHLDNFKSCSEPFGPEIQAPQFYLHYKLWIPFRLAANMLIKWASPSPKQIEKNTFTLTMTQPDSFLHFYPRNAKPSHSAPELPRLTAGGGRSHDLPQDLHDGLHRGQTGHAQLHLLQLGHLGLRVFFGPGPVAGVQILDGTSHIWHMYICIIYIYTYICIDVYMICVCHQPAKIQPTK